MNGVEVVGERIRVHGLVQGVGFRPFVWRLANELGLSGWVRNDGAGIEIEAFGSSAGLGELRSRLAREAPAAARIDGITACAIEAAAVRTRDAGEAGFAIADSPLAAAGVPLATAIGPDRAVCPACLAELCAPDNRRYRYAFTTCTACGPRYTIAERLPYDRARTSLAPFPLCPECAAEYAAPADRRFHAEATCCPRCGPQLALRDARGQALAGDPLAETVRRLCAGEIVAIKGLGGFHLVCDARNAAAVARLRERKQREEKPFALMVANVASLTGRATVSAAEAALLASPARPVVLLARTPATASEFPGVAPGLAWLGVMLPYTPLHVLLFHEAAGRPAGTAWLSEPQTLALVMTSANPGGEPLVIADDEAQGRLAGIADAFLGHDRAIVARCDDSVLRAAPGGFQFLRRGRGFTPQAIRLPAAGPSVLAFGGWYKNSICVTRGDEAFLSPHVGDLDNGATCGFLDETVARLLDLLEVQPVRVARDGHPDFYSSRAAAAYAAAHGLPCVAVQHHHAHIAAVCAEHGVDGPLLGLALDGVGLGDDSGAWGGELLRVEGAAMRRLGHLRPLPLPGGDRAAREPWRMAAAALHELGRGDEIVARLAQAASPPAAATVARMLAQGVNCPRTSSAGRCFDAAAGLLGVRATMAFEGQAAMLLEGLAADYASRHGMPPPLAEGWRIKAGELDLRPLLAHLAEEGEGGDPARGAARFHATLAAALAAWVVEAAGATGLTTVAAAGGCLLNQVLTQALRQHLAAAGLTLLEARRAPPNDGGLALGQAWVALHSEV